MGKIFKSLYVVSGGTVSPATTPIGSTISLHSTPAGYYVSTDENDAGSRLNPLRAAFSTNVGTWEWYRVDDAKNGPIALFSVNRNLYVSVDNMRRQDTAGGMVYRHRGLGEVYLGRARREQGRAQVQYHGQVRVGEPERRRREPSRRLLSG